MILCTICYSQFQDCFNEVDIIGYGRCSICGEKEKLYLCIEDDYKCPDPIKTYKFSAKVIEVKKEEPKSHE